jgi:hypothetical protein
MRRCAFLVALFASAQAAAQQTPATPTSPGTTNEKAAADNVDAEPIVLNPRLTLDPSIPHLAALPGGTTPSFGEAPVGEGDWRFDFHGILIAPLRMGINSRKDAGADKSKTVLHAPPVVPDDRDTFSHTGVVPNPYTQLNLSYGNNIVTGHVSILARQQTVSVGFFDPASQAGINDAYLSIRPNFGKRVDVRANVGAFNTRYGAMGAFDEGRYGTPLIARIRGVGEQISATLAVNRDFTVLVEQGFLGQSNKAPVDITPDGWNDFANASEGSSFVSHFHAGFGYRGKVLIGGHYINAFSQDERATGTLQPDGKILILAGDLRLNLGRFGHFYAAVSQTKAEDASTVGRIIEVMNTRGGPGLMQSYLGDGSGGNGKMIMLGAQYDISIGKLVSYPVPFTADGPDLVVSLFGINGKILESNDRSREGLGMLKFGGEVTYGMLSWLGASVRYDRVQPDVQDDRYGFSVLSPRVIFHTDWSSTDQIVLQYSHWYNGSLTTVRTGYPPRDDVTAVPDEDMVSLSANMWW